MTIAMWVVELAGIEACILILFWLVMYKILCGANAFIWAKSESISLSHLGRAGV